MTRGIRFAPPSAVQHEVLQRTDVACFVGFAARRRRGGTVTPVPAGVHEALARRGWLSGPQQRPTQAEPDLLDVPVPIDGWDVFDHLFDADARPVAPDGGPRICGYLAAAVRSFFAQGGRRCFVVRVGDPWHYLEARAVRLAHLSALIPGFRADRNAEEQRLAGSPADPAGWHGVTHLFGIDEAAYLCVPDLADALRSEELPPAPSFAPPAPPEQFGECVSEQSPPNGDHAVRALPAPALDAAGYEQWTGAVGMLCDLVRRTRAGCHRRDVQILLAMPLPVAASQSTYADMTPSADPLAFLEFYGGLTADGGPTALGSAFLQLAYPWPETVHNPRLPAGVESPDGVLAGILARNALLRGAFRSAAGSALLGTRRLYPELSRGQLRRAHGNLVLADKISLLGRTPGGFQLLSDVTMSTSEDWRPGAVNRLMGVILRAARGLGDELAFGASGETLWATVRERLGHLMAALWRGGALAGAAPADAFRLRCDRTTMTQADIDAGRVIARLEFVAAHPLETIVVALCLSDGGVTLLEAA